MISSLQSLRFVFAIMIFFHHYVVNGVGLFNAGGTCGVSFFIILSGFVMFAGYGNRVLKPEFNEKEFMLKRLIRLYPLHLLCLLGFLYLTRVHLFSIGYIIELLPNIFLLQSWIPIKEVYFSGNAVSWCLADMIFFYAMFPLLAKLLNRAKLKKTCLWFIPLLVAYLFIMVLLPDNYCHQLLYISPAFRLIDFFIGMLMYKVYHKFKNEGLEDRIIVWSYTKKSLIEIFCVLLLTVAIMAVPYLELRYYCAALWWLVMPELILCFALFDKSGGVISSFLKKRWMIILGEISFSMYMVHYMAISVLHSIFDKYLRMVWQVEFAVSFLIILSASYLVFHYYETPVSLYFKKKLR